MFHLTRKNSEKKRGRDGKKEKIRTDRRVRSLRLISAGSAAAAVAVFLLLNLVFDTALGDKLRWDMTSEKAYSIGDISKGIVSRLQKNVEIVGLFDLTGDAKSKYADFIPLLEEYEAESDGKITVRYVDPETYPSILTELDPDGSADLSSGYFAVKCGDMLKVVNPNDCYIYDTASYYYYGRYVASANNLEYCFTGAISSVTSDAETKAYFTTNHGEASHQKLSALFSNNGFSVEDLSTDSIPAIPDDCSLLVIDNPLKDILASDIPLLEDFLDRGGNLVVVCDFQESDLPYDNLNQVLHSMNMNITNSRICENDTSYRIQPTSGYFSYADVASGSLSESGADKAIITAYSRAVTEYDSQNPSVNSETLITTSGTAVMEENGNPENSVNEGTQNIAMYAKNTGGTKESEAVVIGTSYLTSDEYISAYSLDDQNVTFFYSIVSAMTDTENTTQIASKAFADYTLSKAPTGGAQTVWAVILVAIVPFSFLAAALIIHRKRRNM